MEGCGREWKWPNLNNLLSHSVCGGIEKTTRNLSYLAPGLKAGYSEHEVGVLSRACVGKWFWRNFTIQGK